MDIDSKPRFLLFLYVGLCMLLAACGAQQSKPSNTWKPSVRALTPEVDKELQPIRKCLAPDDIPTTPCEPHYALKLLNEIQVDKVLPHERAEIWNIFAYVHYLLGNQDEAIDYYRKIVEEPLANDPLVARTLKALAMLLVKVDRQQEAIPYYKKWLDLQERRGASGTVRLAGFYYGSGDHESALMELNNARFSTEALSSDVLTELLEIERSIYYERGDLISVKNVLNRALNKFPSDPDLLYEMQALSYRIENGSDSEKAPIMGLYPINKRSIDLTTELRQTVLNKGFLPQTSPEILVEFTVTLEGRTKDFTILESLDSEKLANHLNSYLEYKPWLINGEAVSFKHRRRIQILEEIIPLIAIQPHYPKEAYEQGLTGYVVVQFKIGTDGRIKNVRVEESSDSIFETSAISAARKLRYRPAQILGTAVEVNHYYKYTFKLPEPATPEKPDNPEDQQE